MISRITLSLTLLIAVSACSNKEKTIGVPNEAVVIVPTPNKVLKRTGNTLLTKSFWVVADVSDSASAEIASYFVEQLNIMGGTSAYITDLYSTRKHDQSVKIEIVETSANDPGEEYTLDLTSTNVQISGSSTRGLLHGIHTFLQLLDSGLQNDENYTIKKMIIKDQPHLGQRGIFLSNVISEEDILSLVTEMARLKLNLLIVNEAQTIPAKVLTLSEFYGLLIVTQNPEKINTRQSLIDIDQLTELSKEESFNLEGDTCVVRFSSTEMDVLFTDLKLVSEIGWTAHQ